MLSLLMSRSVFYNSGGDNERGAWDFRFWPFLGRFFGFCTENLFVVRNDSGFFGQKYSRLDSSVGLYAVRC